VKKTDFSSMPCPLARALEIVGDGWTLLLLRDALFFGATRFDEFRRHLDIPTNVLTARLRHLVERGVFERHRAPRGNSLHEYRLTPKGEELWNALAALLEWGNRWTTDEQLRPLQLVHADCGVDLASRSTCSHCGRPVTADQIWVSAPVPQPTGARSTRSRRRSSPQDS
jgi:DNA-binding HxlR family transcriptional regulator